MRATTNTLAPLKWSRWLVALATLLPLLVIVGARGPVVHAGGCSPCIHWDSNMIYAGLNNGNPEGPVGENATVHGTGFSAGQTINFALVQGDINNSGDPLHFCNLGSPKVPLPGIADTDGAGKFDYSFTWPAAASSNLWSICSYDSVNSAIGSEDDGPFSVLTSSPVMVSLNKPSFQAGETVPVTGLNWLPGSQRSIFVYIGPCVDCGGAPIASATTTSAADGSFTVNLTIPTNAAPGNYLVSANGYNGLLDVGQANSIPITVTGAIPTATTAAPTATTAPTATSTTVVGGTTGGTHTSSGGDNTGLLIALIVGLVLLLAALAGLVAFLITRRKGSSGPSGPQQPTPVPVGAPPAPMYGLPVGAAAPYGIPDYDALPMPDWQDPNAGWDPSATSGLPGDTSPGQYQPPEDALSELYPPRPSAPAPTPPSNPASNAVTGPGRTTPANTDAQTRASDPDAQTRASDDPTV